MTCLLFVFLHLGSLYNRVLSFLMGILELRMLHNSVHVALIRQAQLDLTKIVRLKRAKGINMPLSHAAMFVKNELQDGGILIADCHRLSIFHTKHDRERESRRCLASFCLDPGEDFASWPRDASNFHQRWDTEATVRGGTPRHLAAKFRHGHVPIIR